MLSRMLSRKIIFFQRYLSDANSHSWKDWRSVTQKFSLSPMDQLTFFEIVGLIPHEDLFKKNIDMPSPFRHDWEWTFGCPSTQYDSRILYSILHWRHVLGPVLNAQRVSSNVEIHWIWRLHSVWSMWVFCKLHVFAQQVIYQGLPSKAQLAKSGLSDGLCLSCLKEETVKHILWECFFMRYCWAHVQLQLASILQRHLQWRALSEDSKSVIRDSLAGIQHCLRISTLFTLWKLHYKYVFDNEVNSLVAFCQLWREEVHMQPLAKGSLLIKNSKVQTIRLCCLF